MKTDLKLEQAAGLVAKIEGVLREGCERIEPCGSFRRCRNTVGDIEFLIIPKPSASLWGEAVGSALDPILGRLLNEGRLLPGRASGEKYKQFKIGSRPDIKLDLFIVTGDEWGVAMAIRTGPAQFSKAIVTQYRFGGLLPDGHTVKNNRVSDRDGRPISTPTEADFLNLCACGYVEPHFRDGYPI